MLFPTIWPTCQLGSFFMVNSCFRLIFFPPRRSEWSRHPEPMILTCLVTIFDYVCHTTGEGPVRSPINWLIYLFIYYYHVLYTSMLPCVSMYVLVRGLVSTCRRTCIHVAMYSIYVLGWTESLASCRQRGRLARTKRGWFTFTQRGQPSPAQRGRPTAHQTGSTLLYAEKENLTERYLKTFWVYSQSDNYVWETISGSCVSRAITLRSENISPMMPKH